MRNSELVSLPKHWRSVGSFDRVEHEESAVDLQRSGTSDPDVVRDGFRREPEFLPPGSDETGAAVPQTGVSRRDFMGLMGASVAVAAAPLSGCIRKPVEHIVPFAVRPEDAIPGKPMFYATACQSGAQVLGLLVESQDGRPTKIEGNPNHPSNRGGVDVFTQAAIFELYLPSRSTTPMRQGDAVSKAELMSFLGQQADGLAASRGDGFAILMRNRRSPTTARVLQQIRQSLPSTKVYVHDHTDRQADRTVLKRLGAGGFVPVYQLEAAGVVVSVDADLLGKEGDSVRNASRFAERRRTGVDTSGMMNRLYVVEPTFSITGMAADHRLRLAASQMPAFLGGLKSALVAGGLAMPPGADSLIGAPNAPDNAEFSKFVGALAKDLLANKGKSAIVVGAHHSPAVHAAAHALNAALENHGSVIRFVPDVDLRSDGDLADLSKAIASNSVKTLLVVDANPVYEAPGDLGFGTLLANVPLTIHYGIEKDETAQAVHWHIPATHFLESWGDLQAVDGTKSVQQPLIAPMFDTLSADELLSILAKSPETTSYEIVRTTWRSQFSGDFERQWSKLVHDGFTAASADATIPDFAWANGGPELTLAAPGMLPSAGAFEIDVRLSNTVLDGRHTANPWLLELPDQVSKLAWDNAVLLSPKTADELGVVMGDMVRVEVNGQNVELAAMPQPGVADYVAILELGYGRRGAGPYAEGAGFSVSHIASAGGMTLSGGKVTKVAGTYKLVSTQDYGSLDDGHRVRPHVREANVSDFKNDPEFVKKYELMPAEKLVSIWELPNETSGQQWGMTVDLNTCIGCNACTIACQAENNITVVGKDRVARGRELHWIRLDRYFVGDDLNDPQAVFQPMPCAQCETAPCESVCPVAATVHSSDGLNDMVYNRCIGTRYCANNCPFKVRRFNYFNFTKENDTAMPLMRLQRNPDVTVRFRGVMEKCTYCVQRITEAKIIAKRDGNGIVPDGAITPACAQTCPVQAITFGDINDADSKVSKQKASPRNYGLLSELNLRVRTTYLAKIRNPNPELV